jgi:hypothetical protein
MITWAQISAKLELCGALLIVAALLVALGYAWGDDNRQAGDLKLAAQASARAAADSAERQRQVDQAAAAVAVRDAQARARIVTVTHTLTQKVPVYVTRQSDARCIVPVGFVRLHDAAAAGQPLPDDSAGADDPAADIALSDVGRTVVDNYGTCNAIRQQLIDLQDLLKTQTSVKVSK